MNAMSNAVVSPREKRSSSGNDDTPEKRLKIGDLPTVDSGNALEDRDATMSNAPEDRLISPEKLPSERSSSGNDDTPEKCSNKLLTMNGKAKEFCFICGCSTDHNRLTCPKRSTAMGLACSTCYGPCDIKEHKESWRFHLKVCLHCHVIGDHWSQDCPTPDDDDKDLFF